MSKYGEPWRVVESPKVFSNVARIDQASEVAIWPIIDTWSDGAGKVESYLGLADEPGHIERAIACVNALAGIENPEAVKEVIAAAREAEQLILRAVECPMEGESDAGKRLRAALAALDRKPE